MTQEEKELLLQDLCARLPYKPRVRYYYYSMGAIAINGYSDEGYLSYQNLEDFSIYPRYGLEKTRVCNILPYLRPMSSMTEEEENEYQDIVQNDGNWVNLLSQNLMNFFNKHHFDYCGLIEKGLAIEAPEGMYDIKTTCNNCEDKSYCSQSEYVKNNCYKLK